MIDFYQMLLSIFDKISCVKGLFFHTILICHRWKIRSVPNSVNVGCALFKCPSKPCTLPRQLNVIHHSFLLFALGIFLSQKGLCCWVMRLKTYTNSNTGEKMERMAY